MDCHELTAAVLGIVREEGFELAGVASARPLPEPRQAARAALAEGRLADMRWMDEDWIERSTDLDRFLPGARSLIVVALPNHSPEPERTEGGSSRGRVARYARGRDYHRVFEKPLRRIARRLREDFGAKARATVDYGPLLERPWAELAGLTWRGKSTMALMPGFGPWVMLGVVATTLELEPGIPLRKSCGACDRCIVACPTGAIAPNGHVLDARLCISYHTIENRGPIPRELRAKFGDWLFGCDACLDACPVGNKHFSTHPEFQGGMDEAFPPLRELLQLDEETFAERFRGRAMMRAKREGLVRNACVVLGNIGGPDDVPDLCAALGDPSGLVRGHAAWALAQIARRNPEHTAAVRAALETALAREKDRFAGEELSLALKELPAGVHDVRSLPA